MSTPGQAVGGLVGAVAGFFLGGGPMGAVYGAQAGLMLGGMLDPPKGPTIDGPGLDDLTVQTSTYGAVIPRVYGTTAVNGNVFWLENNALKQTITKKKSGGKGGGSTTTTRVKTYSATFAVGLCKGPIAGVRRIWIRGGLYYDAGSSDPGTIQASNAAAAGFHVYLGTDTQSPDSRMQATLGVGNTPAWRGLAYIVFYDLQLARYGNSLMGAQVRVEVMKVAAIYDYPLTEHPGTTPAKQWSRPAWNGTVFCAIDRTQTTSNKNCLTSLDGITWTTYALPAIGGDSTDWMDIDASATGTLVAVRFWNPENRVARSTDNGQTWSWVGLPNSGITSRVGYGNGRFVVAAVQSTKVYVSTSDGVSWSYYSLPRVAGFESDLYWSPLFGKFFFSYYSNATSLSYIASSSDGVTWSEVSVGSQWNWQYFVELDGTLYLFNTSSAAGDLRTTNGSTWAQVTGTGGYLGVETDGRELIFVAGSSYIRTDDMTNFTTTSFGYYGGAQWAPPRWNGSVFSVLSWVETRCLTIIRQMVTPGVEALSSVVSQECLQSGILTAGDIDVTALNSSVRGYAVGSVGAIRAALEPLQAAWPFDARQHGYKIQFVMRGGSSVVTIPAADLDARDAGAEPGVQITTAREMDSQLPRRVTVNYLDADREYNRGTQYAERLTTPSINALTLDLPIVLTSTEGAGKAEVLLYLYWLERHDVSITLPPTYNQLESGDVVTLATPEGNVTLRLTAVNYTSAGRVECKAKYANAAIYTPTAVAASPAVTGPTTITPVGASVYALLDIPQISTAQSGPSFLSAMTGALSGWDGGVLMQSTDAGATWAQLQAFDSPGSTLGTASNSLGVVDSRVIDSGSLLNVTLTQGALYSITQLAMFSGQNLFAYGVDGRWEIIAAQTCTLVSGTSYALRDLLRGRFGTEWAMGLHAAGDTIVLLDTTDVALISMGSGAIGLSYLYRGITVDRDISTDSNRTFSYQGVNLKPLSPIALAGARDPSSNDWSLTWIRRTREGGEWRDNVDASLGETSQVYQIDVFADGTYTTVKRTITTSTPDAAYSSADQVADFGSNQTTIYLKIYQLSAVVGRGYPLTQSLTG